MRKEDPVWKGSEMTLLSPNLEVYAILVDVCYMVIARPNLKIFDLSRRDLCGRSNRRGRHSLPLISVLMWYVWYEFKYRRKKIWPRSMIAIEVIHQYPWNRQSNFDLQVGNLTKPLWLAIKFMETHTKQGLQIYMYVYLNVWIHGFNQKTRLGHGICW